MSPCRGPPPPPPISGSVGTAVPKAEYQFDGDEAHGIGYYRVPKSAITELDGSRIPVADKMPNKGIGSTPYYGQAKDLLIDSTAKSILTMENNVHVFYT